MLCSVIAHLQSTTILKITTGTPIVLRYNHTEKAIDVGDPVPVHVLQYMYYSG